VIDVRNLQRTFKLGPRILQALNGVSLSVAEGEFVSIMGPSGAGKSTLLHIMGALDRPSSGSVFFQGEDIFSLPEARLPAFRNRNIGFVFQFHYLLTEFTALENVLLANMIGGKTRREDEARAEQILGQVGLADRIHHKPGELSGGEQQRVAVARALVTSPRVVLADEPTGNLDTGTGQEVFELLRHFNRERNITFILVTHNESLSSQCDRIVRMIDGRILPSGSGSRLAQI